MPIRCIAVALLCAAWLPACAARAPDPVPIAEQALQAWLRERFPRFALRSVGSPPSVGVVRAGVRLQARPLPVHARPAARMTVWVDISVDGAFLRAVPVNFHVEAYGSGWIARRDVAAGQPLDPDAFEPGEVDVAHSPGPPLTQWPARARLRRPLLARQALTASHVEAAPAVVRGARIRLIARQGGIALESAALALQDGWTGQRILVRAPRSRAPLAAQVRAAGLVELMP